MDTREGNATNEPSRNAFLDVDQAGMTVPSTIVKRDGRIVPFDIGRIENAMSRCFASFRRTPQTPIPELARRVVNLLVARTNGALPTVEGVQDIVEIVLQAAGEFDAAKHYILYRAEQAKKRERRPIPEAVRQAFADSDRYFPTPLQKFQFFDKYARFNYELGRRETWLETVNRCIDYLYELAGSRLPPETYTRVRQAILELRAMPSMRLLAMAGPAARRNNITIYNCSYQPVESIDSFVEALIISMSGCGVGFSVESRYVENFPRIKRQTGAMREPFVVADSAEGWAEALHCGLATWFEGGDVRFDLSQLRPAGAPLRTKGGRASGPEPLRTMLDFVRSRILARQGSFLRPIDAHDMMCAVGNAAVSGGVRRCLPAGTRVHTERGAIPIEDVHEGDRVLTTAGYKSVTAWFDQGVQAIVEIMTESGTIFRCTPHHRVAVLTDVWGGHTFKYARDLTPEDRLLFIAHPIDGEAQALLPWPERHAADPHGPLLVQPSLDTEMAWFMGKFLVDGYVQVEDRAEHIQGSNTYVAVACHTSEIDQIERVSAWMDTHGIPARIVYQEGSWVQIRSSNRQIARWMSQYRQPQLPLVVPEALWRATVDVRAAFVAGLMDGAGCYTDRPVTVVSTADEVFGRDIVRLLATLGIVAEICIRRPEPQHGERVQWVVSIKDAHALQYAAELIGTHACGVWVARKDKQSSYTVPGWMVEHDLPHQQYRQFWSPGHTEHMNRAVLTTLVKATHYVPIAVVDVRPGGEAHTYDIEVRDGHMFVAEGYLVHNTAMLSLFDYDDAEMRTAKSGDFERDNSQRWNANNSVVWPKGGLTQREFIHQFMEMVDSGRGEPGIFNREAANLLKPAHRQAAEFGTNPSLRKGTLVFTSEGILPIEVLEGKQFLVRNLHGALSPAMCFLSGRSKRLYKVSLKGGHSYYATAEHQWPVIQPDQSVSKVATVDLQAGFRLPIVRPETLGFGNQGSYEDGFLAGWLLGDGGMIQRGDSGKTQFGLTVGEQDERAGLSRRLEQIVHQLGSTTTFSRRQRDESTWFELNTQSDTLDRWAASLDIRPKTDGLPGSVWKQAGEEFRKGLIDGLFSSDGSIDTTKQPGYAIIVLVSAHKKLIEDVSALLGFYGIKTSIRESSSIARFPNGHAYEREYACYDLTISGLSDVNHFRSIFQLTHPDKQAKLSAGKQREKAHSGSDSVSVEVVSVEATDLYEDVWDISVFDETHCFQLSHGITGNCGEIVLRPWQFCNLTAAVARNDDTFESLREKVEVATIVGTIQSLATHFPGLRPMWRQNCEEERLLGVDITGQMDSPIAQDADVKAQLRAIAIQVNRETAAALGINRSAAVTCVKPSGNSSQMLDCSSGLHARWAPYYIRNVRVAAHSPLFHVLRSAGVPMDPENGQTPENANTWVIHFPVKAPDGAITRRDRSAIAQCEYWLQNKLYWTDHNPSCTIVYTPDEVLDLMKWVWEHRDMIGGLTFLPSFEANYAQMPYVEITAAEYQRLVAEFPEIDFAKIYRYEEEDLTTAAQELACSAGFCDMES